MQNTKKTASPAQPVEVEKVIIRFKLLGEKNKIGFYFRCHTNTRQGCQMVCFQTKNPNLGTFLRVLQWKMMVYFKDTWSILRSFVIFYVWTFGIVRGNFVNFSRFGILYQKNLATLSRAWKG
jgi:hypothetical protein